MDEKKEKKTEEKAAKAAEKEAARAAKAAEKEAAAAAKAAEKEAAEKAKAEKAAEKERQKQQRAAEKAAKAPERARKRKKVFRALALTLAIVLTLSAAAVAGLAFAGRSLLQSDKILPGVTVGGIPVAGLTREEAVAALEVKGWVEKAGGTLEVTLPMDTGFQIDYFEAGVNLTPEKAAEAAYRAGRQGSVLDALKAYVFGLRHTTDVTADAEPLDEEYIRHRLRDGIAQFDLASADQGHHVDRVHSTMTLLKGAGEMKIDEEELYAAVVAALEAEEKELDFQPEQKNIRMPDFDDIHELLACEPQNARYVPETDSIEPEVVGIDFDVETARALWEKAAPGEEYTIPVTITYPAVTAESMSELLFRDLLGECTTSFWGSSSNRINNIELAAAKLNGVILQPGEEFSYNGTVGQRTVEAGFKAADAYVNGGVKSEIGGGICQVSSTLYNAVLSSQLQIVDRTCHMFSVGYLPKGLDATVSWPGPDFKFLNSRDYPVRIAAWVERDNTNLTIQIWGSNVDGTYAVPKSSWGKRFDREWKEKGYDVHIGWDAYSWVEIYDAAGNHLETRKGYSSYYALHDEDIEWPELPEETEETPEDTGAPEISIETETAPAATPAPEATPTPSAPEESGGEGGDLEVG